MGVGRVVAEGREVMAGSESSASRDREEEDVEFTAARVSTRVELPLIFVRYFFVCPALMLGVVSCGKNGGGLVQLSDCSVGAEPGTPCYGAAAGTWMEGAAATGGYDRGRICTPGIRSEDRRLVSWQLVAGVDGERG